MGCQHSGAGLCANTVRFSGKILRSAISRACGSCMFGVLKERRNGFPGRRPHCTAPAACVARSLAPLPAFGVDAAFYFSLSGRRAWCHVVT